ncbi:MAG TPA: group II intron reverse transcriptase/maturase [Thermoanaerobaculia bacterium]|nr:group II intron reverse transcriptase/maturase [Thermoanaerobaculia bacterium]
MRNTRDPSAPLLSQQGGSYKPKAKSSAAQRKSEGIVVPAMGVTNNAPGGKGPCGGRVGGEGKREGMTGRQSRSNHPGRQKPIDKVLRLQSRLREAAKRHSGRRFHALYDRIWRSDVLQEAWRRVKRNKGAAGVDAQTIAFIQQYGEERFLSETQALLRAGKYRPAAVLRRYIPKADGRRRPLGIPTVRDRVVQAAAKLVLEPVFEADFEESSHGFRPGRSATGALEVLRKTAHNHVLDADIRDFFGSLDHEVLLRRIERRVSDRRVLRLVRQWLRAKVMDEGREVTTIAGVPQGGVISPLLANIYLNYLDIVWRRQCAHLGVLVRYADDFVVMCRTAKECEEAERRVRIILERLKLELHPNKTRRVDLSWGKEGFDFLGCHLRKRLSGPIWAKQRKRVYFLQRWPAQRSMKRVRQRVKKLTPRARCHDDVREVIADLNPVLRGWGSYFRTGNASNQFIDIDSYVWQRLRTMRVKRKGRQLRPGEAERWTRDYFHGLGLYRLRGTIQYPEVA